jgi:uncharacterized Zn finger protein
MALTRLAMLPGIASILHRDTIAVIVGTRTFDRGQACYTAGRVLEVEAAAGELRGVVRPQATGRTNYAIRIWVRDDGIAYECTCPIGVTRQFCKHAVAIALAHLERERVEAERGIGVLRAALATVTQAELVDGLLELARRDAKLAETLKRLCLDALSRR